MTGDLTQDEFLGGRVRAWQPRKGYRAATDPVFLAASCPAKSGQTILELGCGVGVASLCLAARVPDLNIVGVEREAFYADLARRNAAAADAALEVVDADLTSLPVDLRHRGFDHVMANPPYYSTGAGTPANDPAREAALREDTPVADWIVVARARLKPKGWLTLIQLADRLPDVLAAVRQGFGAVSVLPLQSRLGRPAGRVIVRARKGARTPFVLHAPLLIHEGAQHLADGGDYTAEADRILRHGDALPLP